MFGSKKNTDKAKTDKDFIEGIEGVYEKTPIVSVWIFPSLLLLLILSLIAWMVLSESEVVSQASAKIVASKGLHLIQPKIQGKISTVPIKQGEVVKKDMVVVELEKRDLQIEIEGITSEMEITRADIFRYESILNRLDNAKTKITQETDIPEKILTQEKSVIRSHMNLFNSEIATLQTKIDRAEKEKQKLDSEISKLIRLIDLKRLQIMRLKPLINQKYTTRDEYDKMVEEKVEKIEDKKIKRRQLQLLTTEIELKKKELLNFKERFYHEKNEKLLEGYQKFQNLTMKHKRALESLKSTTLYSPIDGIVHNLQLYTAGSVVKPGDIMMRIIPLDTPLEVEARVLNRDIGFINEGQKVKFKVDSFPFTKYGYIPGTISKIERAAIKDEQLGDIYPVTVELSDNKIKVKKKWVRLIPGMTGVVDIKTGDRRMIDYIISPFLRYQDEAMKER